MQLSKARHLFFALGVLALLMMPVSYRAGATAPHPHALLQLIYEAANGIPLHHHAVKYYQSIDGEPQGTSTAHSMTTDAALDPSLKMEPMLMVLPADVAQSTDGSPLIQLVAAVAAIPAAMRLLTPSLRRQLLSWLVEPRMAGVVLSPEPPPPKGHGIT